MTLDDLAGNSQPRILAAPTAHALFLTLGLRSQREPRAALARLAAAVDLQRTVVGIGAPLAAALDAEIPHLDGFHAVLGRGVAYPSTRSALWLALYAEDPGLLLHEGRRLLHIMGSGFAPDEQIDAFQHREGRDLSGYVDGTANPQGEAAVEAALVDGPAGLAGASFVSVQRWVHDLSATDSLTQTQRDHVIGRRLSDNEEIADAPISAHVKRTAQEDLGFLLRRSMPWGSVDSHGLAFVAYARDPATFRRHLDRIAGATDGVLDALNTLSRPVSGGLYWCPPVGAAGLDLRALGL